MKRDAANPSIVIELSFGVATPLPTPDFEILGTEEDVLTRRIEAAGDDGAIVLQFFGNVGLRNIDGGHVILLPIWTAVTCRRFLIFLGGASLQVWPSRKTKAALPQRKAVTSHGSPNATQYLFTMRSAPSRSTLYMAGLWLCGNRAGLASSWHPLPNRCELASQYVGCDIPGQCSEQPCGDRRTKRERLGTPKKGV